MPSEGVLINISHAIVLLINLVTLVYLHHIHADVHQSVGKSPTEKGENPH